MGAPNRSHSLLKFSKDETVVDWGGSHVSLEPLVDASVPNFELLCHNVKLHVVQVEDLIEAHLLLIDSIDELSKIHIAELVFEHKVLSKHHGFRLDHVELTLADLSKVLHAIGGHTIDVLLLEASKHLGNVGLATLFQSIAHATEKLSDLRSHGLVLHSMARYRVSSL